MPSFFHKPENALKRAHEFIEVGKKESALDVLNDLIRSRKHRQKWTQVHEDIMMLYTSLCVQLQRSSYAKDGLYQYRTICKEVNPYSFEKVIKSFLKLAEDKAGDARQQSEATVLEQVEDLDAVVTPESLLLSTVSGEGAKERTDRVLLTPWVKFLWESYRNMLELLKNNLVNLSVYSDVAKQAFKFCLNYQRRMEFRKLCDILRNHLAQAEKYQAQQHSLKLDQQEVITGLVDVRFEQLESSIAVDMWQEAFRAIEEIHKLLSMSGKSPKASLLENFYSRQAKVYMMAKNQLFHAAALHKLFVLRKEQKKTLTKEEARITASQVMLATLAVPIEPIPSETDRFLEVDDNSRDKARRLAALLRMDTPPTRAILMKDMLQHNVLQLLSPELQQLYQHLEVEFDPLHLCSNVVPILEWMEEQEHLSQYVELLREITLVRLIKQVSQVYETITLNRLVELAPFATTTDLEKVVVETATSNNIQVRIDHDTKSLCFGMDTSFSHKTESPEGPYVQCMPSEILCNQLTIMSQALQQAVSIVSAIDLEAERLAVAKKACQDYLVHSRSDYRRSQQRGKEIEDRKEYIENQRNALKKQKEDERQQKLLQEREEEQKRLNREAEQRKERRVKKEIEEMQMKMKQEKVDALKNTAVGKRAFADITNEELKSMDADVIFSKQLKQIEKEKKDREVKLKTQEKKVDYFERAKRLVELPLLKQQYEEQRKSDREFHVEQENQKISLAIKQRKEAEEAHVCLAVMREDEARFRKALEQKRKEKHQELLKDFDAKLDVIRDERLAVRKRERKERRKAEAEAARKEEEARQAKQKREEEERKREEERRKHEEEKEEGLRKQRQREQEIEEKMRLREQREQEEMREKRERGVEREDMDNWRGGGGGGGGAYRPPTRGRDEQYDSPRRERRGVQEESDWRAPRDEDRDEGQGYRDEGRGGYRDDRRGPDYDRRGPPRDDFDRRPPRDDFERRPPREDRRLNRDEFDRRADSDRRGGGTEQDSWRRENEEPRREERDEPRRDDRGGAWRPGGHDGGWRSRQRRDEEEPRRDDRGGGDRGRRGYDGYDDRRRREPERGRGDYYDKRPRDYERDGGGGRAWRDGDKDDSRRDMDRERRDYDRGGRDRRGDGGAWRDEGRGGGDRWRSERGGGWYGEGGLRADDRGGGWRGDRSPGRGGGDRGREISPRRPLVDEEGFETVNRRK